ncbi:phosphomethylpyrimidine kinase [Neisseria bacilliformis ATCC BAA-1200]|uniref:hydroxymethylpyrimidine kinase n=1 Tax=Neisseria bacilliformis ATCC BAA-1200 TaxID=888742 RepID=F2BFN3_9NEIS|nr:bifunctional hydroxymethylpyrimidine kinase/phosphomethylpyrimidine kinase [Neisseria bacilliformis]EGF08232.1 phosphomethylpyrimidine kinase [Neisseria bacilliformis ATCC BAA-1200]QMT47121.1 bifunctional hydroxymethylpyrimidine kinase/phosphomethylpyrimidine kinase [Neisseria bacilliformis]
MQPNEKPYPRVLTIAGSDSGGGAGIQADLKTFGALGAYGASVITAVTAQNTQGVQAVHTVPSDIIRAQCESVFTDIRIDAVKIGMLPDTETICTVAAALRRHPAPFTVLDPVLVATSGDSLALENTTQALLGELMPLADLLTPNLSELAALSGRSLPRDENEMLEQGRLLLQSGAKAVLLKGGHWSGGFARDWLVRQNADPQCFIGSRIPTRNTHGTGCTLSSAIAALYPHSKQLHLAVAAAKSYLHGAIDAGQHWHLGHGNGPVAHFWRTVR